LENTIIKFRNLYKENNILDNQFVLKIGPKAGILSRALVQLILKMMWNSFTIVYKHPDGYVH